MIASFFAIAENQTEFGLLNAWAIGHRMVAGLF